MDTKHIQANKLCATEADFGEYP